MRTSRIEALKWAIVLWLVYDAGALGTAGFSEEAKLLASDGAAEDWSGLSVAISGDRVVVGAPLDDDNGLDSGSAYAFDWDGSQWAETKLLASDGAAGDWFGVSVAVSGNQIVVGAPFDDDHHVLESGSAYVFDWDGSEWVETKLEARNGKVGDYFGWSVALSGDRVVVGSPTDSDDFVGQGSAYVFDWDGSEWVETKLVASDNAKNDFFGVSVAIDGDRLVVGAENDDDNGDESGSAYIFDWDGVQWVETKLVASDGEKDDSFGQAVVVEGDRVVVGAPFDGDRGKESGSVYVFDWNGSQWAATKLVASDGDSLDEFGWSAAILGDRLMVGALQAEGGVGSVYALDWNGSEWVETQLLASDGEVADRFGYSLALSEERVVVGAPQDDDVGDSGAVYVFRSVGVPCEDVAYFRARCGADAQGEALLQVRVGLSDPSHDGAALGISLDGVSERLRIVGRRARFRERGVASGEHTIELTVPASCISPQLVTCL